jgi:hypothetical protein
MPGIQYGPVKPTPIKRGIPTKMTLSPDVNSPNNVATVKPTMKPGSKLSPMPKTLAKMRKIAGPSKSKRGTGLGKPHMPAGTGTGMNGLSGL